MFFVVAIRFGTGRMMHPLLTIPLLELVAPWVPYFTAHLQLAISMANRKFPIRKKICEIVWVKPLKEFKGPTLTPNDQQNSHGSEKNHQSIRVAIDHRSAPMRRPANGLDAVLVSETSRHQQTHIQHRVLETSPWKSILCVHMFVHTYYIYIHISVSISINLSIHLSIYLSIYIYIILYIYIMYICILYTCLHLYTHIFLKYLNDVHGSIW